MSDIVIKADNVAKLYRLGEVGTGTLSHDLKRWWALTRGREDPFAKIGESNDRTTKGSSGYVWSLKDVSFEVKKGEVLGVIGRNGAGKSTLLKILSKVTTPYTGSIKLKGRIASLLEVGTGFHPELTGRENIYLNGAILGMTKSEIKRKFDAIVDFSGVERYIDTPVKRYSSGMYVRLAFAVAAHLESEILIVDEVLAVGDAEFQKKCLNKMGEVSKGEGRTVLFVSHNMGAVKALCTRALLLEKGKVKKMGSVDEIITAYSRKDDYSHGKFTSGKFDGSEKVVITEVNIGNQHNENTEVFNTGDDLIVNVKFKADQAFDQPNFSVGIKSKFGHHITVANTMLDGIRTDRIVKGENSFTVTFKKLPLLPQEYYLSFGMRTTDGKGFLMKTKEIGFFIITTRMSDLGIEGPLAEEIAVDSVSPVIPYVWDFGNGNVKPFNITDNAKR